MSWITLIFCIGTASSAAALEVTDRQVFGIRYEVARVDLAHDVLRLHWRRADGTAYGTLADLREALRAKGFRFATNSGIYGRSFAPLGLHIENQRELVSVNRSRAPGGNFSMVPNGIFALQGRQAWVIETGEWATLKEKKVEFATQSGPLLLRRGVRHPNFRKNSDNRKIRSGVGITSQGRVLFVISREPVNFFTFAEVFRALDCADALYLDGTISDFLVGDSSDAPLALAPFVGLWSVTDRR